MENNRKIKIDNDFYFITDLYEDLRAEDSFFNIKLKETTGNGEARKYVDNYSNNPNRLKSFFGYSNWGQEDVIGNIKKNRLNTINEGNCFFSKTNLMFYMKESKQEYYAQEQIYRENISHKFPANINAIESLNQNLNFFSIYDVSDRLDNSQSRAYIRSDDDIWKLWRKIVLPRISYLSILKLIKINGDNNKPYFYFRIYLDYNFRTAQHPKSQPDLQLDLELKQKKDVEIKTGNLAKNTNRNPIFRKKVIEYMEKCPFTKISDERVLIASHIKPHSVCVKENDMLSANDKLNGLVLSPTYDYLFDQGHITFLDDGTLVCGTQLSPYTWSKLNISPNRRCIYDIKPKGREKYLKYHRDNIFQDNLNEVIL